MLKLAVFDFDSTLMDGETIDFFAEELGIGEEVSRITEEAMSGRLDFFESLQQRVQLLKGLDYSVVEKVAHNLPYMKGAKETIAELKKRGMTVVCFSGGINYAGKPLALQPKQIYPFAVVNSYAKNPKTLQKKMQKKIKHGALGIITQPVYDLENAKLLLDLLDAANHECCPEQKRAELIVGLFPIMKFRTAQFLSAHVPGINVPQLWLEKLRLAHAQGEEEEYKVGFELSKTLFEEIKALHPKIHLMTANQFQIAKDILL